MIEIDVINGKSNMPSENSDETPIVLYQADGRNVPVQVRYKDETFWLAQKAMAELFDVTVPNISYHLQGIYESGELERERTIQDSLIVRQEGTRQVSRRVTFYNLDVIIAVGYRVNSIKATRFRQWATQTLREYIIKGFVLNDDMLKNGRPFGKDYTIHWRSVFTRTKQHKQEAGGCQGGGGIPQIQRHSALGFRPLCTGSTAQTLTNNDSATMTLLLTQ